MAQILLLCSEARRKTRIMYQTNLNYAQLKNYLNFLTSKNLLAHKSDGYVTSDKGQRFLEAFALVNDVLDDRACRAFTVTITESHEEVEIVQLGQQTCQKA